MTPPLPLPTPTPTRPMAAARADGLAEFHDWLIRSCQGQVAPEAELFRWFDRMEATR